ncbi:hypothetical protein OAB94_02845, partial [Flavobacteriaceae bacterium]|nr:hypothetical protein [Flavobacteriaceae bacterium]
MKRILLICSIFLFGNQFVQAQNLAAGDIAFIGYNTDSSITSNDNFTFITLVDIPGNEVIYFTEEGWNNSDDTWALTSEGHLTYTAPAAGLSCGTVISANESIPNTFTVTGGGTMVYSSGSSWSMTGGDQVLAYQAATPKPTTTPTFIAGVQGDDGNGTPITLDFTTKWNSALLTPLGTQRSELPAGLTNGTNCVSLFPVIGTEEDNAKYTGTLTGTANFIRSEINDYTNWTSNNSTAFAILPSDYTANVVCAAACTDPDIPTVTFAPAIICDGNSALLAISGDKNDATAWHVYTGSCGGTLVGSTTGSTIIVTPTSPSTTYFVRGEGGCVTPGSCGQITITTTALDNASFNYGAAAYCVDDSDPTPTITGLGGGSFSSVAGLSISATTGAIDVSASTPGTYTVTYTTAGSCPNSSSVSVTVNALDDASFSYSASAYCVDDSDPTPNITGLGGGTFSAGAGLGINASTGAIDVSASTPGTYTVTYTTGGSCPNSSSVSVTVNALPTVTFTAPTDLCLDAGNQTNQTGGSPIGGLYSGPGVTDTGDGINYSFDPAAAGVGTHTITYNFTDGNGCSGSASDDVEVLIGSLVATTQAATVDVDVFSTLVPSDVDNNSANICGGTPFLSFETTSYTQTTTTSSPTDVLATDDMFPYVISTSAFTVPTSGDYAFSMTSSSADGSLIIIWDDTPVPNSGQYDTRPEYFGDAFWFADGTLTSVGGGLAGGVATLEANKTYYMSSFSISFEGPLSTGTFTTTIDQAIRTTAATREYDCADIGTVVETLYVFDAAGNVDSATADVTVSGTAGTGAGTFPVAITQAASFNLDDLGGNATLVPSNINNGSTFPFCSDTFLSFETTSYTQTTTTSSPTDFLYPDDTFPYVISTSAFTVPTSGDYAFSMTSSSADGSVIIIWDDTPVPNSGQYDTRPEYFGDAFWFADGTLTSVGGGLAGGVATLEANKTYYMSSLSISFGGPLSTDTFTTTIDQAIRTTAATREYDCADIGTVVETLYVFDAAGNVDSATADVTVQGVLTTYTAGIWDNGAPTMGSKAVINTPLVTNGTSIEACACDVNAALTIE